MQVFIDSKGEVISTEKDIKEEPIRKIAFTPLPDNFPHLSQQYIQGNTTEKEFLELVQNQGNAESKATSLSREVLKQQFLEGGLTRLEGGLTRQEYLEEEFLRRKLEETSNPTGPCSRPVSNPVQKSATAKRYNQGKVRYDLVPVLAHQEFAKVLTIGAEKYGDQNWRKGMSWNSVLASLERHLYSFKSGEDTDPQSGLSNMAHVICNAAFLIEYAKTYPQGDDRVKG